MRTPARLFISYAHGADDEHRDAFEEALAGLVRAGKLHVWHDREIPPGAAWGLSIEKALEGADIIALLVSNHFQSSDYIAEVELPRALERHRSGSAVVVPIIVSATYLADAPFAEIQALPTDAKPVLSWSDRYDAWLDVVTGISRLLHHLPPSGGGVAAPVFMAPEPPVVFLGRSREAEAVAEALQSRERTVVIRAGTGGTGKTALAAHVARQVSTAFPDGVLWAHLGGQAIDDVMESLLTSLRISVSHSEDDLRRAYLSAFATRRCLIVLDNVESDAQLAPFLPQSGPSRVLATSRYALGAGSGDVVEIPLDPLTGSDATDLLARLSEAASSAAPAMELVNVLGRLPLAIRIASGIMREMGWDVGEYLDRIRSTTDLSWLDEGSDGLRRSFAINYSHLPSDAHRRTFRGLGAFGGEVETELLRAALQVERPAIEQHLLTLRRHGLLETASPLVRSHPLMTRYAAELLFSAHETQERHRWAAEWFRNRISTWNRDVGRFVSFGRATDADASHGLGATAHFLKAQSKDDARAVLEAVADTVTRRGNEETLWSLLEQLRASDGLTPWLTVYWADLVLRFKRLELLEQATTSLQRVAADQDGKVASAALIALARDAVRRERLDDALALLEASRTLKERLEPVDHRGISYVLNEIARVKLHQGCTPQEALELHEAALQIQERLLDWSGAGYTLRRIASIYLHNLNAPQRALDVLARAERLASESDFVLLLITVLLEKAEALARMEHYRRAAENLERARRLAATTDNSYAEAKVLRRLTSLYERLELYGPALRAAQDCAGLFTAFDARQAVSAEKTAARLASRVAALEREEQDLTLALHGSSDDSPDARRMWNRKLKRIRQKLGQESSVIRLGK